MKGGSMILRLVIGVGIGALLGFAFYKFIGCSTGACPIAANPYLSSIFGAAAGFMVSLK